MASLNWSGAVKHAQQTHFMSVECNLRLLKHSLRPFTTPLLTAVSPQTPFSDLLLGHLQDLP